MKYAQMETRSTSPAILGKSVAVDVSIAPSDSVLVAPRVSTAQECRVTVVSDYASFLELELVWNTLVEAAQLDHPFLRHEWVRTWWECFGQGKDLHILVVQMGEEPIAIAPLMVSRVWMYGFNVRRLELMQNAHTPRCDFIIARSPEQAYRAIWQTIVKQQEMWDLLVVSPVVEGSGTLAELPRLAGQDGFRTGLTRPMDSPYVPFNGGWERYIKQLSRNHRAKVRKGLNRLSRRGRVELEVVSAQDLVAGTLEDGLRIEAAAWKEQAGTAIRSQPELKQFYELFAQRAAQLGALRLIFLTIERTRIAFAYALCYQNKLYVLKAGYDPSYARYSPYNLLCYLVFRDGFANGLAEYEFLGCDEEWKLAWTKETRAHYSLFAFPPRLRARILYAIVFQLVPALRRQRLYQHLRAVVRAWKRRIARWRSTRVLEESNDVADPA